MKKLIISSLFCLFIFGLSAENFSVQSANAAISSDWLFKNKTKSPTKHRASVPFHARINEPALQLNLTVPGTLRDSIPFLVRDSLTKLTLTGNIDARDFAFMRDSLPVLRDINLKLATIRAYSGTGGTMINTSTFDYPENELPASAFCLQDFEKPVNKIKSIIFPDNLRSFGMYSLTICHNLANIFIPDSVTSIPFATFAGVKGPISVSPGNPAFSASDGILYDINKTRLIQVTDTTKGKLLIPKGVKTIESTAVFFADSIQYIDIPVSVNEIKEIAVYSCTGIDTIAIHTSASNIDASTDAFALTATDSITLKIPAGTAEQYRTTSPWMSFKEIIEDFTGSYLIFNKNRLIFHSDASLQSIEVKATMAWNVQASQDWIKIVRKSGNSNDTIIIEVENNPADTIRSGMLTFTSENNEKQYITIIQSGNKVTIRNTAGKISSYIQPDKRSLISNLEIRGSIDARDFKFMRDSMPSLMYLDMSQATIQSYSGTEGTYSGSTYNYYSNTIPLYAFYKQGVSNNILTEVKVPLNTSSIEYYAFGYCSKLENINMPATLTSIQSYAFTDCYQLKDACIPDQVKELGSNLYKNCYSLKSAYLGKSITYMGGGIFSNCQALKTIESGSNTPLSLSAWDTPFTGLDTLSCTLLVPVGSLNLYKNAPKWNSFQHIREIPYWLSVDKKELKFDVGKSDQTVNITTNACWTAESSSSWVKINKSGSCNNGSIIISCDSNLTIFTRIATVTLMADSVRTQTINIIQQGIPQQVVSQAGKISANFPVETRSDITGIAVTGTIDYRDIAFIRDSLPALTYLNIKNADVVAYSGTEGNFAANTIPANAFLNTKNYKPSKLETIILPLSVTTIRENAFHSAEALSKIEFGPNTQTIGFYAFNYCYQLKSIQLPANLRKLEYGAFSNTGLESVVLPDSVRTLENYVFQSCANLTKVTIPASITSIGSYAFNSKTISEIYSKASVPMKMTIYSVFYGITTGTCKLIIPKGSKKLYQAADQWKAFSNMIDTLGFSISEDTLLYASEAVQNSIINTRDPWTVKADKDWIHIIKTYGTGTDTIKVFTDVNPSVLTRTGRVEVKSPGFTAQYITIIQSGKTLVINNTAGNLNKLLTAEEKKNGNRLIINGFIDARDFRVLRDSMPVLNSVDLSECSIVAYEGNQGTVSYEMGYSDNEIPAFAFYKELSGVGKTTLSQVIFPKNTAYIGKAAFGYASGLKSIILPESIIRIGDYAFMYCTGLQKVTGGSKNQYYGDYAFFYCRETAEITSSDSTRFIGERAFSECYKLTDFHLATSLNTLKTKAFFLCSALKSIEVPSGITVLEDDVFNGCSALTQIKLPETLVDMKYGVFYACAAMKNISIPVSVTHFGPRVFGKCTSLASISIPASVKVIDYGAFEYCTGLRSIYAYSPTPVDLSASSYALVFNNVIKSSCTLYVPTGSKALYANAVEWSEFTKVVEMSTGIKNNADDFFRIYPVPARDYLNISGISEPVNITISDMSGRIIIQKHLEIPEKISVSELSGGIYLLTIQCKSGVVSRNFRKE